MRLWICCLALVTAFAAGCNRVYVPEGIDPLPEDALGHVEPGFISLLSNPDDAGLVEYRNRKWVDPEEWAAALVRDIERELRARGINNHPDAAHRLYLSLSEWGGGGGGFTKRVYVTLTAYTPEGDVVHEARYTQNGMNYRRALRGVMYRCKEGLLSDPAVLELISR